MQEVVGRGATGLVLKARDRKLQRVVAIKVLAPRLAASAAARQRFVREAQAAAAVRDDHVVGIHDVNDEGPLPYLVMEYIAGITLQDRIRQGGPLDLREVLRIGMQVAKGIAAAHAQGLIHRDIKPGNILLENGVQRVRITDFGLALAAADAGLSEHGVIAGTPEYMSPCQARCEPMGPRSDLFSLGAVLYTLCIGRPPFGGDSPAAILKSVREDTPPPIHASRPDVPPWLCDAIDKLLAKRVEDRFATAQEVADLLTGQLAQLQHPAGASQPPAATPTPPAGRPSSGPRGRTSSPLLWLLAFTSVVAVLGALAALSASLKPWHGRGAGDPPAAEEQAADTAWQQAAGPPTPLDLRREAIPPSLLALAGGGDPTRAPQELVAVLGDGRFLLPYIGQTAWPRPSPDGRMLAVPLDEDVVLFETPSGRQLRTLKAPGGRVFFVAFSPDSQLLVASTRYEAAGGSLRVWDLAANRPLFTAPNPGLTISCAAAFSPDSRRLLTESDGALRVWDPRSGRQLQDVALQPKGISGLGFSPDGRRLAVANWHGNQVRIFNWSADRVTEAATRLVHPWPVTTAVYSPDGRLLASADLTRIKLWDARTLQEVRTIETDGQQLAFAPDSRTLYATTTTEQPRPVHTFTRWDVAQQHELPALKVEVSVNPVRAFHCLSPDGRALFVVQQHDATYVRAIDTATGTELFPHFGHVAPVNVVAVSPNGRTAASAGEGWEVKVWDLATGKVRHSLRAHNGAVGGLAFSPDGSLLASGSRDGTIALWDVSNGTEVRALHGHSRAFPRIQFSPDGRTLAAGSEQGTVRLWEVASGNERSPLPGHAGAVRCVAFRRDGTLLASAGDERVVRLRDRAGRSIRDLRVPSNVNHLAFSPDGRILAAVTDAPNAAVCLWDLQTGQETIWQGHSANIQGLAFSPTAPVLATCGADGTVRLWNLSATGPRVRTIGPGPFGGPVRSVAFTPDGRYLLTANANGTVYVLRVDRPAGFGSESRSSSRQRVPEGRQSVARGASPWSATAHLAESPGGAAEACRWPLLCRPSGAQGGLEASAQGLAPLATDWRPSGAGTHRRLFGTDTNRRLFGADLGCRIPPGDIGDTCT